MIAIAQRRMGKQSWRSVAAAGWTAERRARYALSLAAVPSLPNGLRRAICRLAGSGVLQWTRGVALAGRTTRLDSRAAVLKLHRRIKRF